MSDFDRWSADHGDETLRLDYSINSDDIVIDCGAYHGAWSRKIYDRYRCKIIAFEPVKTHYLITNKTLSGTGALIYHAGLGPRRETCTISVAGDASSVLVRSGCQETIEMLSIDDIIQRHALSNIRLMKINIEGSEYDLLDHMLRVGIITLIDDIQVQFHDFIPNAILRRQSIRAALQKTHVLTYDYEFIWENWRIIP